MLPCRTPALHQCVTGPGSPEPGAVSSDEAVMAFCLITTWAVRTGRTLRPVPISALTAAELEAFWTDDLLSETAATPDRPTT